MKKYIIDALKGFGLALILIFAINLLWNKMSSTVTTDNDLAINLFVKGTELKDFMSIKSYTREECSPLMHRMKDGEVIDINFDFTSVEYLLPRPNEVFFKTISGDIFSVKTKSVSGLKQDVLVSYALLCLNKFEMEK